MSFLHPNTVVCRSQCALDEFSMVSTEQNAKQSMPTSHGVQRWCAPEDGWVKVNWDASIDHDKGWMG
jgi:hypothetical protein